jgi:exosome complex component RRP42
MDPQLEEERVANTRLTITIDESGAIRAMQKGLSGSFTIKEVSKIIESSITKAQENRKYVVK